MKKEIGPHLPVSPHQGAHGFRMEHVLLPGGRAGDQSFDVQLVRIEQEADERHLVVGFVADIAEDDQAANSSACAGSAGVYCTTSAARA
jgi:hypothetical protein